MYADERWSAPLETKAIEPWRHLLLDAADVMERNGFAQGRSLDVVTGGVCSMGAVILATGKDIFQFIPHKGPYGQALDALDARVMTAGFPSIISWNDIPGRTKSEAVAMLRSAALD